MAENTSLPGSWSAGEPSSESVDFMSDMAGVNHFDAAESSGHQASESFVDFDAGIVEPAQNKQAEKPPEPKRQLLQKEPKAPIPIKKQIAQEQAADSQEEAPAAAPEAQADIVRVGKYGDVKISELEEFIGQKFEDEKRLGEEYHKINQLAAKLKERLQGFEQKSPEELLAERKLDPDAWAYQRMMALKQEMELTPEQRQIKQLENELSKHREESQKSQAQKEKEQKDIRTKQLSQYAQSEIVRVVQAAGIPNTPEVLMRTSDVMSAFIANGRPLSPNQIAEKVIGSLVSEHRQLQSKMTDEQFEKYLTEDGLKRAANILQKKFEPAKRQISAQNARIIKMDRNRDMPMSMSEYLSKKASGN